MTNSRKNVVAFVLSLLTVVTVFIFITVVHARQTRQLYGVWDYLDSEISLIERFEVRLDSNPYQSVGIPTAEFLQGETGPGWHTYVYAIPYGNGPHTFSVRACDSFECSDELSAPYHSLGSVNNLRIRIR